MLLIRNLTVSFPQKRDTIHAVNGLDIVVRPGTIVGLVGESGSGKSVSALSILHLLPQTARVSGDIIWRNTPITAAHAKTLRGTQIGMIFQNPMMSFNPVLTMGHHFIETIQRHHPVSRHEAQSMAIQYLNRVQMTDPAKRLQQYPHEFSLGMCQRAMIALTLCMSPSLLIADEPTASLDVTVQAQIMALLTDISQESGMSILFISHDLGLVAQHCHYVYIMYLGQVMEHGATIPIFTAAHHPYTQSLLSSIPNPDPTKPSPKPIVCGEIPSPCHLPTGCRFQTRCPKVVDVCRDGPIPLSPVDDTHSRCIRMDEDIKIPSPVLPHPPV